MEQLNCVIAQFKEAKELELRAGQDSVLELYSGINKLRRGLLVCPPVVRQSVIIWSRASLDSGEGLYSVVFLRASVQRTTPFGGITNKNVSWRVRVRRGDYYAPWKIVGQEMWDGDYESRLEAETPIRDRPAPDPAPILDQWLEEAEPWTPPYDPAVNYWPGIANEEEEEISEEEEEDEEEMREVSDEEESEEEEIYRPAKRTKIEEESDDDWLDQPTF